MRRKKQSVVTDQVEVEIEDINEELDWEEELDLSDDIEIDIEDSEGVTLDDEDLEVSGGSDLEVDEIQSPEKIDESESLSDATVEAKDDDVLDEMEDAKFTLEQLTPSISKTVKRIPDAGLASLVNSKKNGKRFSISSNVINKLGDSTSLQIGFIDGSLIFGESLGDDFVSYPLKKYGAKKVIYNKGLVEEITEHLGLDFSNRTSITFHSVSYKKLIGQTIAIISL